MTVEEKKKCRVTWQIISKTWCSFGYCSVGELEMIGISSDYRVKKDLDMRRIELAGW